MNNSGSIRRRPFHKYDLIMKKIANSLTKALLDNLIRKDITTGSEEPEIVELSPLEVEIPLGEKVVLDKLYLVKESNGGEFLLHVEFQTANDPNMFFRMFLYQAAILKKYGKFASQIVVYLGKEKVAMESFKDYNKFATEIRYKFVLADIKTFNPSMFLGSDDPGLVPLALLARCEDYERILRDILKKILALRGKNHPALRDDIENIAILSQLRDIDDIFNSILKEVKKSMGLDIDIRENALFKSGYEEGLEKGIEVGMEKGIEVGMEKGIEVGMEKGIEVGMRKGGMESLLSVIEERFGIDGRMRIAGLLKGKDIDSGEIFTLLKLSVKVSDLERLIEFIEKLPARSR